MLPGDLPFYDRDMLLAIPVIGEGDDAKISVLGGQVCSGKMLHDQLIGGPRLDGGL